MCRSPRVRAQLPFQEGAVVDQFLRHLGTHQFRGGLRGVRFQRFSRVDPEFVRCRHRRRYVISL